MHCCFLKKNGLYDFFFFGSAEMVGKGRMKDFFGMMKEKQLCRKRRGSIRSETEL